MCFILSDLKCYGNTTLSFRNHLLNVKERSNQKITREIKFPTYKTHFCSFFFLWTPLTFKLHNFLISYSFKTI